MADVKRFEFPKGVSANQERRYLILEVVDLFTKSEGSFDEAVNSVTSMENGTFDLESGKVHFEKAQSDAQTTMREFSRADTAKAVEDVTESYNDMRLKKAHEGTTICGIALPYPDNFQESSSQNWSSSKGVIGTVQGSFMDKTLPIVGMNVSKFVGQVQKSQGVRKPVVNPGYFQDYEGPDVRQFSFQWTLIPNSIEEAREISLIIYNLKKFMSPTSQGFDTILLEPFSFNITMMNQGINQVQGLDLLVCKNLSVDWASKSELYPDGSPKQVTLKMEFQERSALMQNDY